MPVDWLPDFVNKVLFEPRLGLESDREARS